MEGNEFQINTQTDLKYLFEATYKDGHVYSQGKDDSSLFVPGKNAFFDILYQPFKPLQELVTFALVGAGHRYEVNLKTGMFAVDGVEMQVGPDMPLDHHMCEFRLVFFKRHRHNYNLDFEEKSHEVRYALGWQTTISGKNYEQIIFIK